MAFCANALAQTAHQASIESDLRTDLNAPLASSLSQYYQPPALLQIQLLKQQQEQLQSPQTLAQLLGIYQAQLNQQKPQQHSLHPVQQTQISPFLYLGQFTSSDTGEQARASQYNNNQQPLKQQQNQPKRKSDDQNTQNQERSSYALYRPSPEESHEYVDLAPPAISNEEPNYYAMLHKPRKQKKFVEEVVTDKKLKARKDTLNLKHQIKRNEPELIQNNNNDEHNEHDLLTESTDYVEQSEPTSRLDFQMHGHKGPKSYKFGYDFGSNAG
ncbi:unnamed protein product [Chironomus riparius]|uniref:Uncharacterized protein n=1 Tax=Chironomus riparius TaxID=315576 RepID=A0A9N9RHZ3_9DIPT|nr:unnamed protein product [Chironomus riparius]